MNKTFRYFSALFLGLAIVVGSQLVNIGSALAAYPATSYANFTWSTNNLTSLQEALEPTIDSNPSLYEFGYYFSFNNGSTLENGYLDFNYSGQKIILYQVVGALAADPNTSVKGITGSKFNGGYQIIYDYDWQVGTTYALRLVQDGAGEVGSKWGAYLSNTFLGDIEVPTNWKDISNVVEDQLGYIGPSLSTCNSSLAPARVNFSAIQADGKSSASQTDSSSSTACQYSYASNLTVNGQPLLQLNVGATPPAPPSSGGGGGTTSGGGSSGSGGTTSSGSTKSTSTSSSHKTSSNGTTSNSTTKNSTTSLSPSLNGVVPSAGSAINSTASSLTNIKSKHHTSALATAAEVTGIIILIVLMGWGGYLLFVRYTRGKPKSKGSADSDMAFDKTLNKTIPNKVVHKSTGKHPGVPKLSRDEYIGFGQEAILLQDLKDRDSKN